MKFLLTSSGISNDSIRHALVDLLGKPIEESSALVVPTAWYAYRGGLAGVYQLIRGIAKSPLCELGWKSLGVLELTALPSIRRENWVPLVQEVDALLVGGGELFYLCYWMRQSGLADLLPRLRREAVHVGLSGGSMVVTPPIGVYDDPQLHDPELMESRGDRLLGLVDFAVLPHLDNPDIPDNSLADAEQWAAGIPVPAYAIDDQTAIQVVDGAVDVISEGHWKLFALHP
jgi:dipeptidase E